jgi:hypothetical protein
LWTSGAAARARILELRTSKVGYRQVARLAGVSARQVLDISSGKQQRIAPATEAAILGVRPSLARGQRINGWRERRLIDSLRTEGFPDAEIARRLGYLTPKLQLGRFITVENALRVRTLYAQVNAELPDSAVVRDVDERRTLASLASPDGGALVQAGPVVGRRRGDRPTGPGTRRGRVRTGEWWWFDEVFCTNHILLVCEPAGILPALRRLVAQDGSREDFRAVVETLWLDGLHGKVEGCAGRFSGTRRDGLTCGLVWFPPSVELPTIAHELFHATAFALTRAGVGLSDDSEEAWAYYVAWLTKCVRERLGLV